MTGRKVDVEALEETMDDVVETLALAEQAAEFVQASSDDPQHRARAAAIQQQAEAMLDAAEQTADAETDGGNDIPPPFTGGAPSSGMVH